MHKAFLFYLCLDALSLYARARIFNNVPQGGIVHTLKENKHTAAYIM